MSSSPSASSALLIDAEPIQVPEIHPDYNFEDADIFLLSSDGTLFHVHAPILKLSSSIFRDMLAVKRVDGDGPIELAETKATLTALLDIIYPACDPASTISLPDFRSLASAAEKYDMTHATRFLQDVILGKTPSTTLLDDVDDSDKPKASYFAIKTYLMALDFGWASVANELSAATLSYNLNSEGAQDLLFAEGGAEHRNGVKELLALHRKRKTWIYNVLLFSLIPEDKAMLGNEDQQRLCESFFEKITSGPPFIGPLFTSHTSECPFSPKYGNGHGWVQSHSWWAFKAMVFRILEADASGVQFLADDFYESKELLCLTSHSCCGRSISQNERKLRKHFRLIVEHTPKTIEGFWSLGKGHR